MKSLRAYIFSVLIDSIGSGLFVPLSLIYFSVVRGLPLPAVGSVLSIAGVVALVVPALAGKLVDRIGARTVVLIAQFLQGAGFIGYFFVSSVAEMIAPSLIIAIGVRTYWSSIFTLTAGLDHGNATLEHWFGRLGMLRAIGYGAGAVITAVVIATADKAALHTLVIANGASYFLAAFLLAYGVANVRPVREEPSGVTAHPNSTGAVWRDVRYVVITLVNVPFALASVLLDVALPAYVTSHHNMAPWLAGVLLAANTLGLGLAQQTMVRFLPSRGRVSWLMIAGTLWVAWSVGMIFASQAPGAVAAVVLMAATAGYTVAELIHNPVSNTLSVTLSPPQRRGTYMAFFQYSFSLANVIAPAMFTRLVVIHDYLPWVVVGAFCVASMFTLRLISGRIPDELVASEISAT